MKKIVSMLTLSILLLTSGITNVFAADQPVPTVQPTQETSIKVISTPTETPISTEQQPVEAISETTTTAQSFKDGYYVSILYQEALDKEILDSDLVSYTLELYDVDGNLLSKAVANANNYSDGKFLVRFDVPEFSVGDKFNIMLRDATSLTPELVVESTTIIEKNQYASVEVLGITSGLDTDPIRFSGTKDFPLRMAGRLDTTNNLIIKTTDDAGNFLGSVPLKIVDLDTKKESTILTNAHGIAIAPREASSIDYEVTLSKEYNNLSILPTLGDKHLIFSRGSELVVNNVVLSSNVPSAGKNLDTLTVATTSKYSSDLSTNWSKFSLVLKSDKFTQSLPNFKVGDVSSNFVNGAYKLSVTGNNFADIKLNTSTLRSTDTKSATISATATPKYTLEVLKVKDKKQIAYNFKVINIKGVQDKVYSGTKPTVFAVAPGEGYMIQDMDTNEVMTVNIGPDAGATQVILGQGIISGKGTNPYTGDTATLLISGLLFSVLALGALALTLRRKQLKASAKTLLSLLLIFSLVFSSFSLLIPQTALAAMGGGPGGGIEGKLTGAGEQYQYFEDEGSAVIRVYAAIAVPQYAANSYEGLTYPEILNVMPTDAGTGSIDNMKRYSTFHLFEFYMAPTQLAQTRWENGKMAHYSWFYGLIDTYSNPYTMYEDNDFRLNNRTLPVAGTDSNLLANNKFYALLSKGIQGKNLMTTNYGSTIQDTYDKFSEAEKSAIIQGYMQLIGQYLPEYAHQSVFSKLDELAKVGNLAFVVETVPASYKANGPRNEGLFLPISDYLTLNFKINGNWDLGRNIHKEAKVASFDSGYTYISGCNGTVGKKPCTDPICIATGHLRFSGRQAVGNYVKTIRPVTDKIPDTSNITQNPFGAWGFLNMQGIPIEKQPGAFVEFNATILDAEGTTTDTKTLYSKGWEEDKASTHPLNKMKITLEGNNTNILSSKSGVLYDAEGNTYKLLKDGSAPFTMTDSLDATEILDTGTASTSLRGWDITLGVGTASNVLPTDIAEYLNYKDLMRETNYFTIKTGTQEPKYYKAKDPITNEDIHGDAKIVVDVKAIPASIVPEGAGIIPQWRLSTYDSDILDVSDESNWSLATSTFSFREDDENSHVTSYLDQSGYAVYDMVNPDLSTQPWFRSATKPIIPNDIFRNISHDITSISIPTYGDLLSIKENTGIDNIKLADWVANNPVLAPFGIGSTNQGATSTRQPVLPKTFLFKFGIDNPNDYTHYRAVKNDWYDDDDDYHEDCYLDPEDAPESNTTANYNITRNFRRYFPVDTEAPKFDLAEVVKNGFASVSAQSPVSFKVNPEVPMLFADQNGSNTIAFTAGDKLREVKPVSYHTMTYDATVKPTVVGTAIATDARAQVLASNLSAGGKSVILKGSGANISFDVNGTLTSKSYILDIGTTPHKNAWNPGTTYDATKIDATFMNKFGSYDEATKKWNFIAKATENLKIANKLFGNNMENANFDNTSNTIVTHRLIVRGGKLVAVDGDYNYKTNLGKTNPELLSALENMKLSSDETVLSVFLQNKGDMILEDEDFITLGNAVRGTSDLVEGKGWYNEDTTALVVHEYTHTFKLPVAMFADKIPMSIEPNLDALIDKTQFYSRGVTGHTLLRFGLWANTSSFSPYDSTAGQKEGYMLHDSSVVKDTDNKDFGGRSIDYVVPNVSILDSAQ